ncbi:hypothetical protein ACFQZC_06050 [Streptacidiphilus monticola]
MFLVCVSTQALAVHSATLALTGQGGWLPWPALGCFLLGLVLYGAALVRFDLRQVLTGAGDQWVAAGALSISALAAAKLASWQGWTGPCTTRCGPRPPSCSVWRWPGTWCCSPPKCAGRGCGSTSAAGRRCSRSA